MALRKEWLVPLARALVEHEARGPVYMLGDQEAWFTHRYAARVLRRRGLLRRDVAPAPDHVDPRYVSLRTVLEMLGLSGYYDVDLNGRAALQVDLSRPLPEELRGVAGTVIDIGTIEHIFDPARAFANVVELLAEGGTVVHLAPVSWYEHGFYNFNPLLFPEFYGSNGFAVLEHILIGTALADSLVGALSRVGREHWFLASPLGVPSLRVRADRVWMKRMLQNVGMIARLMCMFVGRKGPGRPAVVYPVQGMYRRGIEAGGELGAGDAERAARPSREDRHHARS